MVQPEAQIFGANLAASHGTHEPSSFASNSKDKRTAEAAQRKLDKYKDLILEAKSKLKEAKKENEKLQDENARLRAAEAALEDEINGAGNKDDLNVTTVSVLFTLPLTNAVLLGDVKQGASKQ